MNEHGAAQWRIGKNGHYTSFIQNNWAGNCSDAQLNGVQTKSQVQHNHRINYKSFISNLFLHTGKCLSLSTVEIWNCSHFIKIIISFKTNLIPFVENVQIVVCLISHCNFLIGNYHPNGRCTTTIAFDSVILYISLTNIIFDSCAQSQWIAITHNPQHTSYHITQLMLRNLNSRSNGWHLSYAQKNKTE